MVLYYHPYRVLTSKKNVTARLDSEQCCWHKKWCVHANSNLLTFLIIRPDGFILIDKKIYLYYTKIDIKYIEVNNNKFQITFFLDKYCTLIVKKLFVIGCSVVYIVYFASQVHKQLVTYVF